MGHMPHVELRIPELQTELGVPVLNRGFNQDSVYLLALHERW